MAEAVDALREKNDDILKNPHKSIESKKQGPSFWTDPVILAAGEGFEEKGRSALNFFICKSK